MQLFYTPDIDPSSIYSLNKEESTHCVKVLRLKEGDNIHLTDGLGNLYVAEIIEANPKHCLVQVRDTFAEYGKRNFYIHVAIAPTKNISRIEWFLEKATEMGIDEITPIICEHSERDIVKNERLEKVIVSALKQSLKAYMPKLNEATKFKDLVKKSSETNKFIGFCAGDERYKIKDIYKENESVLLLIGPEGDFSEKEVLLAKENGFKVITMGEARLRTETAALYALLSIHFMNL